MRIGHVVRARVLAVAWALAAAAAPPAQAASGTSSASDDAALTPAASDGSDGAAIPRAAPDAALARAARAEERFDFGSAAAEYRAAAALAPESSAGERAAERLHWLEARAEGAYAPLAVLEQARRDPSSTADASAVATLAARADAMPPGLVRVEARMVVAEAWRGRLGHPDDALRTLRQVVDDPSADPVTAHLAAREIVECLLAEGRPAEAAATARARASALDPRFVTSVSRLARRPALRGLASAALVGFLGAACAALASAARRQRLASARLAIRALAPIAAALGGHIALAGGGLALAYGARSALPFVGLGIGLVPFSLAARAWGAVGSDRAVARAGRAALSAAGAVAMAFLILDRTDPTYLDGFGL
jgi:hypothetical protein